MLSKTLFQIFSYSDVTLREAGRMGGIRTPGAFRHTRFPGVHNQPLCHPSRKLDIVIANVL